MHTVDPGRELKYKIVQCQDPMCNICTSAVDDGYGMPPSPPSQGIVVYTCSNPSCSLCDGDYSLLLDIMNPTLPPEDDWVLTQDQTYKHMMSSFKKENKPQENKMKTESTRQLKRKMPGLIGCSSKLKREVPNDQVINRDCHQINRSEEMINNVDDNQLMNLAIEFELDKIHCLPDLHKDIITELC